MRAIYFPFTTLSEPILNALLACFEQVVVYQPSRDHVPEKLKNLEAGGRLRLLLPDKDDNDPLLHLLKAYHEWARLHEGEPRDFEKFRPPRIPYTDEATTSRIRSDIRKAAKGTETIPSREDKERLKLLKARLFLTVAQENDRLRQSLRADLDKIEEMEKNLFQNLISDRDKMFQGVPVNQPAEADNSEHYLPDERMTAWAHLHVHYQRSVDEESESSSQLSPLFLVTSDPFVMGLLLEQSDEADIICTVSEIPFEPAENPSGDVFFKEQHLAKLMKLTSEPAGSTGPESFVFDTGDHRNKTGRLTIYRVKGDAVENYLSRTGNPPGTPGMNQGGGKKQYTLVGSITDSYTPNIF